MNKFLPILFLWLYNFNLCYSQSKTITDKFIKQNKVNTSTQFECDKYGKDCEPIIQFTYNSSGKIVKSVSFSGKKPSSINYLHLNQFGEVDTVYSQALGQKKYIRELFKYKGALLTEEYDCYKDEGCSLSKKYEYTKSGLVNKKIEFREGKPDTEFIYTYDKIGNNIETHTKFINSKISVKEILNYNKKNKLVKSVSYGPKGERLDSTTYKYDSSGRLIYLDWIGGLDYKNTYKYDKDGNEIEYISMSRSGQVTDYRRMTYSNGLVTTRIHYDGNQIEKYFKFIYTYYKKQPLTTAKKQ